MDNAAAASDNANRTTLDASETSATTALYRAAIGPINTDRYLRIFERFEAAGRSAPQWNWAAAFTTLNWMAFRGLWGAALAYVGSVATSVLLLFGIGRLVYSLSDEALWAASGLLLLLTIVIPGLWGNAMFHAASRKRMAHALSANHTVEQACAMLLRDASSRRRWIGLALANAGVAVAVVGAVLGTHNALPSAALPAPPAPTKEVTGNVEMPATAAPPATAAATETASSAQAAASATVPAASAVVESPAAPAPVIQPPLPPAADPEPPAAAKEPEKPVKAAPAKAKPPKAPTSAKPVPATPKFFANAGLFADATNAKNAHGKLVEAGMAAFTQEVTGPRGSFTRVRVGPFKTREEAVAAVLKIRNLGLDAEVVNPP